MVIDQISLGLGLATSFVAVIISFVVIGVIIFAHFFLKKHRHKELMKMLFLMLGWAVFASLNYWDDFIFKTNNPIHPLWCWLVIIVFFIFLPPFWKVFDRKLLIIAGISAIMAVSLVTLTHILQSFTFEVLKSFFTIIPPLLGHFMIIKYIIEKKK